jgi:hypothetical protein
MSALVHLNKLVKIWRGSYQTSLLNQSMLALSEVVNFPKDSSTFVAAYGVRRRKLFDRGARWQFIR